MYSLREQRYIPTQKKEFGREKGEKEENGRRNGNFEKALEGSGMYGGEAASGKLRWDHVIIRG